MLGFITSFFDSNDKEIRKARKTLQQVNDLEASMKKRSWKQLRTRIKEIQKELKVLVEDIPEHAKDSLVHIDRSKGLPDYELRIHSRLMEFMPEVFAMVREVMRREFGKRHYDVQIIAGIILAQGQKLTELKTGEGKTQVFHLPLILYSLAGRGAHLITVNDYLARRDGEYLGHVANYLGLTVGVVPPGTSAQKYIDNQKVKELKGEEIFKEAEALGAPTMAQLSGLNLIDCSKREAYECDITVGVNNEFGFDYLRDNMASSLDQISQRELYFCIVDEADSILIDEARTPLIISALPEDSDLDMYKQFAKVAKQLEEDKDYEIDHKTRTALMTEEGLEKAEKALGVENLWADYSMAHHLENALKAKALFLKDDHYILQDGEVLIVDQFTGRVMPGRRYSEGIHQAIEAKERVSIQQESKTMATITFQNFFRLYKFLSGGSGTVMTEAEEFYKIYHLESVEVPTNKPVIREDRADLIYRDQNAKYKAVVLDVKERYEAGQPVLVGTTSVEKSELVSRLLDEVDVPHDVLNAKYHEREAQIVAKAGQKSAVTVATNMAGRGTDIPLGEGVREVGGLAVIGTERHEARRIDNQLRGRSGRQGDPGYSRFFVALDDQIMRVIGGEMIDKTVGRLMQDDTPIELKLISRQIEGAQKRIEGMNFDTRKNLVDYDDVMNKQREVFYSRRRQLLELAEQDDLESIESNIKGLMDDEVRFIVQSQFQGDAKLTDEEAVQALTNHVLDLAPDNQLAKAFDIPSSEFEGRLMDSVRGKKESEVLEYISHGVAQLVDAKIEEIGKDLPTVFKALLLESMNRLWMEHLETMNDIRSGITLQSYAQRDPLVEYKTVGFRQFEEFMQRIDASFARRFLKISRVAPANQSRQSQLMTNESQITDILTGDREMPAGNVNLDDAVKSATGSNQRLRQQALQASGRKETVKRESPKVGRNDPCPCGSGKKYKHCGLRNTTEHQKLTTKAS